jgi:hypothetical protein
MGVPNALETQEDYAQVVEALGVVLPDGFTLVLQEVRFDPAAWTREISGGPAVTSPVWRYRFKVVPAPDTINSDLGELLAEAKRSRKGKFPVPASTAETLVIALSDCQFGKVDRRGGTLELLERLEHAKAQVIAHAKKVKPAEIVLIDVGDAVEMFESAPGADRTNDLQVTEQIRVWRRVFWSWVKDLAPLSDDMKVSKLCPILRTTGVLKFSAKFLISPPRIPLPSGTSNSSRLTRSKNPLQSSWSVVRFSAQRTAIRRARLYSSAIT